MKLSTRRLLISIVYALGPEERRDATRLISQFMSNAHSFMLASLQRNELSGPLPTKI